MEINRHIAFRNNDATELVIYLQNNNISYDIGKDFSSIDIYESNPHWKHISEIVRNKDLFNFTETIFSKEELQKAEWLRVRSQWHYDYPQPENAFKYETITYTREIYCQKCGCGLKQIDSFRMKKAPKWGTRHFLMVNWIADELFVSETAKTILQNEGFSNISFLNVKNKKGTELLSNIYQMAIHSFLENGFVEHQERLHEVLICPQCGSKKYHPNGIGMYAFKKNIFENAPDIVKTSDWYGWGRSASHLILIRQKVYQCIIKNHLDKSLVFEPIELI